MATNPYYQRAFNAIGGTLARARQMVNEFSLIQLGFDKIGSVRGATKYQLACSDLTSDLEVNLEAGGFVVQRAFTLAEISAALLVQASSAGAVTVQLTVNGSPILSTPITIDEGEVTSFTAAVQPVANVTVLPKGTVVVVQILAPGNGAKGLVVGLTGSIEEFL